jgi:outer membrane protein assembly factor BamD
LLSCSNNKSLAGIPSSVKWETAERYFSKEDFNKAIPYYQQLVFERNSIYTAEAQYKLGECYFFTKKYIEAIFEYQELIRLFPDNALAPEAQFRIGESYIKLSLSPNLSQYETDRAIESFQRFIEKYPQDKRIPEANKLIAEMQEKLIEKTYLNGYIYYKLKDYPASQLYLNEIIDLGKRNELEKKSVFYSALIHIDRQEGTEATKSIEHLQKYFPDSDELKTAQKRYNRMNSKFWRFIYFY